MALPGNRTTSKGPDSTPVDQPSTQAPDKGNGVVWEDPSPKLSGKVGRIDWRERLAPLVECPGRWARVLTVKSGSASFYATAIKQHRSLRLRLPPGRWDAVSRLIAEEPGKSAVYARYLGPEEPAQ